MPSALNPETQIAFAARLVDIERLHLGAALARAVGSLDLHALDSELRETVPAESLQYLATFGLRGETFFPVSIVLTHDPRLLGYYRLLYGVSQKELYRHYGRFRAMEEQGILSSASAAQLDGLLVALVQAGAVLLTNLADVSVARIRDLQLLTVGAQLRGSLLNEIGRAATRVVFQRIRQAVSDDAVEAESATEILLTNSSGRRVRVAFASDPDIAISEETPTGTINRLSVEIKAGKT